MRTLKRLFTTIRDVASDHFEYRAQIGGLAKADLAKTYRGSALGWAWAPIKPAVTIFVFWFAFEIALRSGKPINNMPYFLWLIAGMMPWFYISEMLTQGSNVFNRYTYLVNKIRFPVAVIPTFVSLSKLFIHVTLLALVVVIFIASGYPPDIYYLQLPVYMAAMYLVFSFWSLFASVLSAVSSDFSNLVTSFVTAIFWLSGVLWDVNSIEIVWLKQLLHFNPVTFFATGYRNVFIYKRWFFEDSFALVAFISVSLGLAILALTTFHRLRKELPDVL